MTPDSRLDFRLFGGAGRQKSSPGWGSLRGTIAVAEGSILTAKAAEPSRFP